MDLDPSRNHKRRLEEQPVSFYFKDSDDEAIKDNWEITSDRDMTMQTYRENTEQTTKEIDSVGANESVKRLFSLLNSESRKDGNFWREFYSQLQDLLIFDEAKESLETSISDSNYFKMTLLHLVCKNDPPTQIVKTLIDASPRTATFLNESDMLPLHVICKYQASEEAIQMIYNACPSAVNIRDKIGRFPLHYLFDPWNGPAKKTSSEMKILIPSPSLVKIIAGSPELASTADINHTSPLSSFVRSCKKIRRTDGVGLDKALEIMRSLLDLSPMATTTLLAGIYGLPKWLFQEVILHTHISSIVNAKSAEPKFLAMLMMDLIVQVILIACFMAITISNVDGDAGSYESKFIAVSFSVSITLLVIRQSVKLIGMYKLGLFPAWAGDMWNWFNTLNVLLILYSGIVMIGSKDDISNPSHKILIMIAGGMQWFVLLIVLRTAYLPFSVFVRGIVHIVFKLFPFLLMTIILFGSFAFMFFTAYSDSNACSSQVKDDKVLNTSGTDTSYCTISGAIYMIYGQFVNNSADVDDIEDDGNIMFLTVVFSVVVSILYFNILIAVVTDIYGGVESSGRAIFWRNRFVYSLELEAGKNIFCRSNSLESSHSTVNMNKARDKWEQLIWDLASPTTSHTFSGNMCDLGNRIFISIHVFLWLLIGLMTLGILLPPQVREWIICVKSKRDLGEKDQIDELGNELKKKFNDGMMDLIEKIDSYKEEYMNIDEFNARIDKMNMEMKMERNIEFDELKQLLAKLVNEIPAA